MSKRNSYYDHGGTEVGSESSHLGGVLRRGIKLDKGHRRKKGMIPINSGLCFQWRDSESIPQHGEGCLRKMPGRKEQSPKSETDS